VGSTTANKFVGYAPSQPTFKKKSAQTTTYISPPLQRWDNKIADRPIIPTNKFVGSTTANKFVGYAPLTTKVQKKSAQTTTYIGPPLQRWDNKIADQPIIPTNKFVGYDTANKFVGSTTENKFAGSISYRREKKLFNRIKYSGVYHKWLVHEIKHSCPVT
jgi:hypothetical protein